MNTTAKIKFDIQDLTIEQLDIIYHWIEEKDTDHFGILLSMFGLYYTDADLLKFFESVTRKNFHNSFESFMNHMLATRTYDTIAANNGSVFHESPSRS